MNQFIFAEREASGMTSTWDEFLCVSLNEDRTFCVYTGRREVLAEASEYYNEDTDEYEIPEEIDGQAVWGIKDVALWRRQSAITMTISYCWLTLIRR